MVALSRRLSNGVARALRVVRRRLFPNFDTRHSGLALAYHRWARSAARLDYVDDIVGHRMFLDQRDSLRLSVARMYQPILTRLFEREVRPGQTVVDLGANIGYFTLLLARRVGPAGRVVAFEPDPTNFGLLERNVTMNGYTNVTLERRAVWSETGPLRLYLSDENRGDHRVYDSADGRRSVTIDAVRLDDYFGDADAPVHWLKMDIQGSELHALRSMPRLLARSPALTLVTEFWPSALARSGGSPEAFLDALQALGFAFEMDDEQHDRLVPVTRAQLLAQFTVDNDDAADLVCRRR